MCAKIGSDALIYSGVKILTEFTEHIAFYTAKASFLTAVALFWCNSRNVIIYHLNLLNLDFFCDFQTLHSGSGI